MAPIDLKASMGFSTSWPNTSFTSLLLERFWAKLTILLKNRKKIQIWLSLNLNMLKLDADNKSTLVQITHKIQSYICDAIGSNVESLNFSVGITDKRTDAWFRDFIIWKMDSGQWGVVWAGLWNKRVWADYEQLLRPFF